jgi:hypothetical protein
MSTQITTAFVQQFEDNVMRLAQQKGSRLREAVTIKTGVVGEYFWKEQIAKTAAVKNTTRHGDTPLMNTIHLKRRGTMWDFDWADLIDEEDKLRMLIDPTSDYAANAADAMARAMDDEIIAAFKATVVGGKDSGTSYLFGYDPELGTQIPAIGVGTAGNVVGVAVGAADSNFHIAKWISAKMILGTLENDPNDPTFLVCGESQLASLLKQTKVTSSDYNTVKSLVTGEVNQFMGMKVIISNRLPLASGNIRSCFAFKKNSMCLAIGAEKKTRIEPRIDKRYATQVYLKQTLGAVRLHEYGVVEILCDEDYNAET